MCSMSKALLSPIMPKQRETKGNLKFMGGNPSMGLTGMRGHTAPWVAPLGVPSGAAGFTLGPLLAGFSFAAGLTPEDR